MNVDILVYNCTKIDLALASLNSVLTLFSYCLFLKNEPVIIFRPTVFNDFIIYMMCYTFTFIILNWSVQYLYLYAVLFKLKKNVFVSRYTSIQLYDRLGSCLNGVLTLFIILKLWWLEQLSLFKEPTKLC